MSQLTYLPRELWWTKWVKVEVKKKGKMVLLHAMEALWVRGGIAAALS
jgi:hypothetical protein